MEKVVADDVPTANVLWMAAERIGKTSSNGDEIQRICDYLVNKHWFQTAGDLRMAQLATEEWHSLQIPSRLKIAVKQVLDDAKYIQEAVGYGYDQQYYYAADGSVLQHQGDAATSSWSSDQSAAGYEGYYYGHDGLSYSAVASSEASSPTEAYEYQYSGFTSASSGDDASYAGDYAHDNHGYYEHSASVNSSNSPKEQPMEIVEAEYASEPYASDQEVVEAHAVIVEDATSYEEILVPMARYDLPPLQPQPPEWSCRQCTYLNPMAESFCEMCADHISMSVPGLAVSPAAANGTTMLMTSQLPSHVFNASEVYGLKSSSESTPPPAAAVVTPPPAVSLVLRHTWQAGGASAPPLSSLYAPSAPSFDDTMAYENSTLPPTVVIAPSPLSPPSPSLSPSVARQLAFQTIDDGSPTVLIHPTKVVLPPPPQQADFLALAFNKKSANNVNGSSSPMAAKYDQ
uniref:RanBP2-type domain-containing protein n=1 Tax=Globisporangium ultimum (strain ATCC 200006 / CBS 805.95 / DAOM BR144) TaxID=431595 RepID=K3X2N6_GLOUD